MFRNLLLASVTTLGLLSPAIFPAKAEAGSDIRVEFRSGPRYSGGYVPLPRPYPGPLYPGGGYPGGYLPPVPGHHHHHHFHVLYRSCSHEPWRTYGTYRTHSLAHEIVDQLRWDGYQARVAHH